MTRGDGEGESEGEARRWNCVRRKYLFLCSEAKDPMSAIFATFNLTFSDFLRTHFTVESIATRRDL